MIANRRVLLVAARALGALSRASVLLVTVAPAGAGAVLTVVPSQPDPAQRYLIYSHGQIVEERGPYATTQEYRPK